MLQYDDMKLQKEEASGMETIQIKYFTDKIEKLSYIGGKSDWIDLRAAQDRKSVV